jgi:uncharacterized protein YdeI (YjbR/CyaY-like superfamily)
MNPRTEFYWKKAGRWQTAIEKLRVIALDCGLEEELKWGCPCYTLDGNNIVLIHVFKEYCAYLFFKGSLMKDTRGILVQQTKNVQAARQVRFKDAREVIDLEPTLRSYIKEAIKIEKAGLKVELKKTEEFEMPAEFKRRLDKMPALKEAFKSLTPGRQRGYLLHFSSAKRAETRESRIEKCLPLIMKGKGLDD